MESDDAMDERTTIIPTAFAGCQSGKPGLRATRQKSSGWNFHLLPGNPKGSQMRVEKTAIEGVLLLTPRVFEDQRGFFLESWNQRSLDEAVGQSVTFVQDNRSHSARGVLRGLHYQTEPHAQGKLVSVLSGAIFDVVVDLRRASPSFGKSLGLELKAEDHTMIWIPAGFAHGFLVLSEFADVVYKATDFYSPSDERCIRWDDAELAIEWPLRGALPILAAKDAQGLPFAGIWNCP
jgi:dTDP-4-dehydrorhamnose 3,5-epimerase